MHKNKDSRVSPAACTSITSCPPPSHRIPCRRLRCQRQSRAHPPPLPPLPPSPPPTRLLHRCCRCRSPVASLAVVVRLLLVRLILVIPCLLLPPPPSPPPPPLLSRRLLSHCRHRPHCRLRRQRQSHAHPPPTGASINARTSSWCAAAMADADATGSSSSEAIVDDILMAAAIVPVLLEEACSEW